MKVTKFVVHAPLLGYRRPKDKGANYEKYQAFKEKVRILAYQAALKIESPQVVPIYLSVLVRWEKGPKSDWSNVYKSIEDALYSNDRWVRPGKHQGLETNTSAEEAIVIVESP